MGDHVFKSKYSMEEIERNFKDADFFNGIKEGLEEALAYEKGIFGYDAEGFCKCARGFQKNCRILGNRTKYAFTYRKESDLSYISETRSCTYAAGSTA